MEWSAAGRLAGNPAGRSTIPSLMPLDAQRVLKPLQKVHKALGHPSRHLTPEGVHKLRTQCYRVESMLRALSLNHEGNGAQLLQAIEPIRKRAGKVRDMDVLIGLAATLPNGNASEPFIQLVEDLGIRHDRYLGKLEKTLYRQRGPARRKLKRCMKGIDKELAASMSNVADQWRRNAVTHTLDLSSELAGWPMLRADNLHPFRLKVKELRYVLQLSSDSDRKFIDALGEVKDAIGEWHDWSELAAVAAEVLGDQGRDSFSKRVASVVQSKSHHAFAVATHLRRQFFGMPQAKHQGRRTRRPKIKTPVLSTAARLAA